MKSNEIEKLKEIYLKRFKDANLDSQTFDFRFENDFEGLTYEEALNELNEKLDVLIPTDVDVKEQELIEKQCIEKVKEENTEDLGENGIYREQCNFVIIAKKGAAKTTLGWAIAEKVNRISKRKVYAYNFPKPELLEKLPFEVVNVKRLDALFNITDGVVILDESQETFNVLDKRVNQDLRILLGRSRQNNTDFLFIAHNSFFVNRSLFSFIDVVIVKEVAELHWELERPHMKKLYQDVHVFGKPNFYIDSDYVRGYKSFNKPVWWTEEMSYAYKSQTKTEDFFK